MNKIKSVKLDLTLYGLKRRLSKMTSFNKINNFHCLSRLRKDNEKRKDSDEKIDVIAKNKK